MRGVTKVQMIDEIKSWIAYACAADVEGLDVELNKDLNRLPERTVRSILDTMMFLEQTTVEHQVH